MARPIQNSIRALSVAGVVALVAVLAAAEQTRILGVQFSKEAGTERLTLQSRGPLPPFTHTADPKDMTVTVKFQGASLAADSVRIPLPDSACVRSAQLAPCEEPSAGVELVLRLDRWVPYGIVQQGGSLVVVLVTRDLLPAAPSLQAAAAGPGEAVAQGDDPPASDPSTRRPASQETEESAEAAEAEIPSPQPGSVLTKPGETTARRVDKPEDFGLQGGAYDSIVTLDARDQTVEDIVRLIAAKGKINILFNPRDFPTERVTLHLENVRLGLALENILRTNALSYVREGDGILRIVRGEAVGKQKVELKTDVIVLNWVKTVDLKDALRPFIGDSGAIEANEENNSLIITDTPPNLEELRALVQKLDEPERQVMIEIHLVDVLQDYSKNLGIQWEVFPTTTEAILETLNIPAGQIPDPAHPGQFIPDPLNPAQTIQKVVGERTVADLNDLFQAGTSGATRLANTQDKLSVTAPLTSAAGTWTFGQPFSLFGSNFWLNATIQADASRDTAQVLANPRVITLNNLEAKIRIEEQIPFIQGTTVSETNALVSQQVQFKPAGEQLTVTPTITANGYVRMEIELKQEIFRGRTGNGALDPPQIDERESTTNVIVRDGTTIALGGLEGHRVLSGSSGIPWLMDIPVLRWAFQKQSTSVAKSTLYLFVRPKIVEVEASELTEKEKFWFDGVQRNWNIPDEYFDNWEGSGDANPGNE